MLYGNSSTGIFGLGAFNRNKGSGRMVEVVLGGHSTLYHVYKRPFVDFFLRTVSSNLFILLKKIDALLFRFRGGTPLLFSPLRCRNMQIRSSIGSMLVEVFSRTDFSEM
jgi:hypothetical protein